jgi:hypothetical protein
VRFVRGRVCALVRFVAHAGAYPVPLPPARVAGGEPVSTFTAIDSACGRITTSIDIFDYDLNPHGVICCGECITIIQAREAWMEDHA